MSGQNKRINNTIKIINDIIADNKLNCIHPIRFLDDPRDFDGEYGYIITTISEVIGELRGLTLDIAGRTEEKKKQYKGEINQLINLRIEMEEMRRINV